MSNEMNVTRALAEIKSLDARINTAIRSKFVAMRKESQQVIEGIPLEDYKSILQSNYDSAKDMIKRRHILKRKVVLSNAVTKVIIGESEMTVAEAIDLKNTIQLDKNLLVSLSNQYSSTVNNITNHNMNVEREAENQAKEAFGNKQKSDSDEYNKFVKEYKDRNSLVIVDSIDISKQIEKLTKFIETFEMEVDFVLSESNALTKIVID